MNISPSKAIRMYAVSKPTLYKDMKAGRVSFATNDKGKRKINIAELERVYDLRLDSPESDVKPIVQNRKGNTQVNVNNNDVETAATVEIRLLKERVSSLSVDKDNLQDQLKRAQGQIDKALEIALPVGKLLEDHRAGQGGAEKLEQKLDALELANEKQQALISSLQKRISADEQRTQRERRAREEQSLFSRIFKSG